MKVHWKIRRWVLIKLFGKNTQIKFCGSRIENTYVKDNVETTIILRDTTQPNYFSRKELYEFAKIIIEERARTGWNVFDCFDPQDDPAYDRPNNGQEG